MLRTCPKWFGVSDLYLHIQGVLRCVYGLQSKSFTKRKESKLLKGFLNFLICGPQQLDHPFNTKAVLLSSKHAIVIFNVKVVIMRMLE